MRGGDSEYVELGGGGRNSVHRRGDVVIRDAGPWAPSVHSLLHHLERVGFAGAPRVVGGGFDAAGREMLTFIEGEFTQPGPWSLDGAAAVGTLLRDLHDATASYTPPPDAVWFPWHGRDLGGPRRVIGHCDVAPWNIVARDGMPVALIDWETAGPTDPLVELAQACWLNAKLHDDIVAEREGLPPLAERAQHLRAVVDGYGLPKAEREHVVDRIVEFVVCDTANEADDATEDPWGVVWRARAGAWIVRNRRVLQNAL